MITIQQAIYGENSGHALLAKSESKNDVFNRISGYTDLNDRPAGGALSYPIIKGIFIENHYVLIRIFPDLSPGMRPGRVFSHALILDLENFLQVNNICDLFQFHLTSIEKKVSLEPIIYNNPLINSIQYKANDRESSAINALAIHEQNKNCIVWLGEDGYWSWIARIWSNLPIESKIQTRIGTAFNPQNVKEENLNLIFIPSELITSWSKYGYKIIDLTAKEKLSSSIALRLAGEESRDPMIKKLLDDFELEINSIQGLSRLEGIGKIYSVANPELNRLLVFSNLISKINPHPKSGSIGKQNLLMAIVIAIPKSSVEMVQALQYQTWKGFENGKSQVERALQIWLDSNLLVGKDDEGKAMLVSDVLSQKDNLSWWHLTIKNYLLNNLKKWKDTYAVPIWNWISINGNLIPYLFPGLQNDAEPSMVDKVLIIDIESATKLLEIANQKKWLILHGIVAIKHFEPLEAFSKQLAIDKDQKHFEALSQMSKQVPPKQIIEITLSLDDVRLNKTSGQLIKKQPSLLSKLDVTQVSWQKLWFAAIEEGAGLWNGITNPTKTLHTILDQVLNGSVYHPDLLVAIGQSDYVDLSKYGNRKAIWDHLPSKVRVNFLDKTAHSIFEQFLIGSVSSTDIERPILDMIRSDQFISNFLTKNRVEISKVIKTYEDIPNLKDQFLADYITNYPNSISESEASRLGSLVSTKKFDISARRIYDKTTYQYSFYSAYLLCSNLVNLSFFERTLGRSTSTKKTSTNKIKVPKIIILTAINVEYQAVREHLTNISEHQINGALYEAGEFKFQEQLIANVVIRETGPKNTTSSQETEKAISGFRPDMIFFVGIAGSRKPQDFSIGDVIIPEKVYYYESGKATKNSFKARPDAVSPSHDFIDRAKIERNKGDWKGLIIGDYNKSFKADLGIIASGEQLVEHYDSEIGKIIYEHYNDASAVEMENYGFLRAVDRQSIKNKPSISGVIRGISDVLEMNGENVLSQDRRPENAKQFASDTAAAFAFWMIFKLCT